MTEANINIIFLFRLLRGLTGNVKRAGFIANERTKSTTGTRSNVGWRPALPIGSQGVFSFTAVRDLHPSRTTWELHLHGTPTLPRTPSTILPLQ